MHAKRDESFIYLHLYPPKVSASATTYFNLVCG